MEPTGGPYRHDQRNYLAAGGCRTVEAIDSAVGADTSQPPEIHMNAALPPRPRKAGCSQNRAKRRDFYRHYGLLLANWYLLTSRIQNEVESIREDLHDDLARWRPHQPEPDWGVYVDRISLVGVRAAYR